MILYRQRYIYTQAYMRLKVFILSSSLPRLSSHIYINHIKIPNGKQYNVVFKKNQAIHLSSFSKSNK